MIRIFVILSMLFIAGCTSVPLEEKKEYWSNRLRSELPLGSTRDEVYQWFKFHNFEFNDGPDEYGMRSEEQPYIGGVVEAIEGKGIVCSHWNIWTEVRISESGVVTDHLIKPIGICL